jgi:hypothetical protein
VSSPAVVPQAAVMEPCFGTRTAFTPGTCGMPAAAAVPSVSSPADRPDLRHQAGSWRPRSIPSEGRRGAATGQRPDRSLPHACQAQLGRTGFPNDAGSAGGVDGGRAGSLVELPDCSHLLTAFATSSTVVVTDCRFNPKANTRQSRNQKNSQPRKRRIHGMPDQLQRCKGQPPDNSS